MDLTGFRQKYPEYGDLADAELLTKLQGLHKTSYSDMEFDDFASRIGIAADTKVPQVALDASQYPMGMPQGEPQFPAIGVPGAEMQPEYEADIGTQAELPVGAAEVLPLGGAVLGSMGLGPGAGTGIGYGGGIIAKELIQGLYKGEMPEIESLGYDAATGTVEMAAMDLLALKAIKTGGKALQIAGEQAVKGGKGVAGAVRKTGMPISVESYLKTDNPIAKFVLWSGRTGELATQKIIKFGEDLYNMMIFDADALTPKSTGLLKRVGRTAAKQRRKTGMKVKGAFAELRDRPMTKALEIYEKTFYETAGGDMVSLPMPKTQNFLKEIENSELLSDGLYRMVGRLRKLMRYDDAVIDIDDFKKIQGKIKKSAGSDNLMQEYADDIWDRIFQDFDAMEYAWNLKLGEKVDIAGKATGEILKQARKYVAQSAQFRELGRYNPIIKRFMSNTENEGSVVSKLWNSGRMEDIGQVRDILLEDGKQELWDELGKRFFEDILNDAVKTGKNGRFRFNPELFMGAYENATEVLRRYFPSQFKDFRLFAQKVRMSSDDLYKYAEMAGREENFQFLWDIPTFYNKYLAQSLYKPTGFFRRWLDTGLMRGPKGTAVRKGTAAAVSAIPKLGVEGMRRGTKKSKVYDSEFMP